MIIRRKLICPLELSPVATFQEIVTVNANCVNDDHPKKVNLSIGAYRDEQGKPWILPVVKKVEIQLAQNTVHHDYTHPLGLESFVVAATKLLLGWDHQAIVEGRAFGIQTVSGTGALWLGAELLSKSLRHKIFYVSNPWFANHPTIFKMGGFDECRTYRYLDPCTNGLDIDGLIEDLKQAPEDSVIVLQACGHNPCGVDPSKDEWKRIADVMQDRNQLPFFDSAYQGFASGSLNDDAWAVRYFADRGFELLCAQSFSKNMGLYNERAGNLTMVVKNPLVIPRIKDHIGNMIRVEYSNPPNHGSRIVATVLNDEKLFQEWEHDIQTMSSRIKKMKRMLRDKLVELKTPGKWEHLVKQIGMYLYPGLTEEQVKFLTKEKHIYLPKSGRMNTCGLNLGNIDYVAQSVHQAVLKFPSNINEEDRLISGVIS